MALQGYLDVCAESLIAGWVWDRDDPERRFVVEIRVDGESLTRVPAKQYREDLEKNGIGDGTYAFCYTFPSSIDAKRQEISVVALGADVYLPRSQTDPLATGGHAPLNWPPIEVDLDAEGRKLQTMHDHVNSAWSRLGRIEPYWSVLSHHNFTADSFSQHKEEFFESGKPNIEDFSAFVLRSGADLSPDQTCFELGCGVGRLTAWLSPMFSRVIAADISFNHLQIAKIALEERGIQNVLFLQPQTLKDLKGIGPFDVFFSVIVFQHNPPPIIAYMLRTILQQLKPGGIGYFQIPTYSKGYAFDVDSYLSQINELHDVEMHVLPQRNVIDIVYASDCKLLEIREDDWTGDVNGISNTFLIQKKN